MGKTLKTAVVMLALLAGAFTAQAAPTTSNLEREKYWADQIVGNVVVGEVVWLQNRGHKFLALHAAPAQPSNTAIVLIHGRGVHPAWGIFDKLYRDLSESGYHVLSLQMPILGNEAKFSSYGPTFPEAFERIDAGIAFLRKQQPQIRHVVLLGHSSGAMIAVSYTARHGHPGIAGVVAVGLSTLANGPDMMQPAILLKSIQLPMLDIYGSNDISEVTAHNRARQLAAEQAGNRYYRQQRVPGADHFFSDHYPALLKATQEWLTTLPGKP